MSFDGELLKARGGRMLAVDDQPENLELVAELLGAEGYEVTTASDGVAALEAVRAAPPDVIVLDIMMPRLDGIAACRQLKADPRYRYIPVVMLTALSEVGDKVRALEAGADDFLNKPVVAEELLTRVRSLLRIKRLRDELDTTESVMLALVQALDQKAPTMADHAQRCAWMAARLARRLGLPDAELDAISRAALLHDIGNIGAPDRVLASRHRLTESEERHYRQHPALGAQILAPLRSLSAAAGIIRHHHERLDGSGYPDGLAGRQFTIPIEIVAMVNHYDDLMALGAPAAEGLRAAAARGEFRREIAEAFLGHAALPPGGGSELPDWRSQLAPPGLARGGHVLVADDTRSNREMFEELLTGAGYWVSMVESGEALLKAVAARRPDLVLCDIRMPGVDGFAACRAIKSEPLTELLPVILVTARHEASDRRAGIAAGADDFLSLPINRHELQARVASLLRLKLYHEDLEDHRGVLLSLAAALEAKDPYTRGHSERVGTLSGRLARELGGDEAQCELLKIAGQLHDIGKIAVPEALLNKPGALDEKEFQQVMSHPVHGERLCKPLRSVRAALPLIRHHHERFNGSGYPDRLAGEKIPYGARVLAVADAFDALTSERSYRKTLGPREALDLMARETERGLWDPQVFGAMTGMIRRRDSA